MSMKKKPKGYRTLSINIAPGVTEDWLWCNGKKNTVIINPEGKRFHIPNDRLESECDRRCKCCGEPTGEIVMVVLPGNVRRWIDLHLRK